MQCSLFAIFFNTFSVYTSRVMKFPQTSATIFPCWRRVAVRKHFNRRKWEDILSCLVIEAENEKYINNPCTRFWMNNINNQPKLLCKFYSRIWILVSRSKYLHMNILWSMFLRFNKFKLKNASTFTYAKRL